MNCLGIESTAHTFGASLWTGRKRVTNEKNSFESDGPGIVPREVARWHREHGSGIIGKALQGAKPDLIAYSLGPGIGSCLQVGYEYAVETAKRFDAPLVGVNHCVAHLEIGRLLCKARDPVLLYASGANTQVIAYEGKKYRVFGETLDIGAGNLLDKFARHLGLGFPGGPALYELSLKSENYVELPYGVKGMDVCFSGLLTRAKHLADAGENRSDLAFSLQESAFSMLVEVAERAMAHCDKKELLLGGGVACSKILQEKCRIMCEERGAQMFVPANEFLVDNAAMIAWQGVLEKRKANKNYDEWQPNPQWRTDEVKVDWR